MCAATSRTHASVSVSTKEVIGQLSAVYGLRLRAEDSHRLTEWGSESGAQRT
jgi:hypothetical protein